MKRRVLVTGASGGIGRAVAVRLAQHGFQVTVHYRTSRAAAEETRALIKKKGKEAALLSFDVSRRAETRRALEKDLTQHGPYWGVASCAGITADAPFPGLTPENWDQVLDTNLGGFYNVLSPLIMPMIQTRDGGRVVALSSVSGIMGNRGEVNYSAAEAGIIGAVKALSKELGKRRISVNSVAPGLIESKLTRDLPLEEMLALVPMRRMGKPEEVAALVAFLFSPEADYITGQVISINGGLI
ncbi:MAG: 3-oxoacyl-ACP reductase FabG [Elusimicrobia bacterium]|nr:3-oxoacyl-ACP reductase FabG [Elusimicrobiota bacterium]